MTGPAGDTQERTPLGELLEESRVNVLHLARREAARRAGISDTRWRQVVAGWQIDRNGVRIRATPTVRTLIAMAQAVNVDVRTALNAANIDITDEALAALLREKRDPAPTPTGRQPPREHQPEEFDLADEIDKVMELNVSAHTKLEIIRQLVGIHREVQAERQAAEQHRQAS